MASAMPPPGGDVNRGPELLAVIWVFTILALLTVAVKTYTRFRIIRETGLDDALIFFSMLLILICTILFTVDVHYGMGRHAFYLTPDQAVLAAKINYIANPFGIMAYSIPNISIAIFLDRILAPPPVKKWAMYGVVIAQNIIAAISCVLLFVQCTPTASLWNPVAHPPISCLNFGTLTGYSYFVGAFTAFTDILLAAIPIVTLSRLQMKRNSRIAVSILMGFTLVAAICAIVKTSKLNELEDIADFTYASVDLIITAVVEANVIIIAACIPSLRPFVRSIGESITTSRARRLEGQPTTEGTKSGTSWLRLSSMGVSQKSQPTSQKSATRMPSAVSSSEWHDDLAPVDIATVPNWGYKKTELTTTQEYV